MPMNIYTGVGPEVLSGAYLSKENVDCFLDLK